MNGVIERPTTRAQRRLPEMVLRQNRHDERAYFFSLITFRVEGRLYRVPRAPFDSSSVFASKVDLPPLNPNGETDGVVELVNVKNKDFLALLKVLLPHGLSSANLGDRVDFSTEELIALVQLASEWDFPRVLEIVKRELTGLKIDPVNQASLAMKYDIPGWLYPACAALTLRESALLDDEAEIVGLKLANRIGRAREKLVRKLMAQQTLEMDIGFGQTVIETLVEVFGDEVNNELNENDSIFLPKKARVVANYSATSYAFMTLERDEIVSVLHYGEHWQWIVRKSDGKIGTANGELLFPLKKKYQYSTTVIANKSGERRFALPARPLHLKLTGSDVPVEIDPAFKTWNCIPARLNGEEGFVFKWLLTIPEA